MRDSQLKVLGLNHSATEADIKKAYRRLSKKYHPDLSKDPNATEKFIAIDKAYDYLTNPENEQKTVYTSTPQYHYQETDYQKWRREARERQKKAAHKRLLQQIQLIKRINRFSRSFIIPLFAINLILTIDWILPKHKEEQAILETTQVFERSKRARYYSYDKISFEKVNILVEKGSWSDLKNIEEGIVVTTMILGLPRRCFFHINDETVYYKNILGVYDTFGFIIPIVLILALFFFLRKDSHNQKLSASCILFFIFFFQLFLYISTG